MAKRVTPTKTSSSKKSSGSTQWLKFKGLVAWCRLYEGQEDEYAGVKNWKVNFYPSDAVLKELKDLGLKNRVKDDDGESSGIQGKYIVLKRPLEKTFGDTTQKFLPAEITNKSGDVVKYKVKADGSGFDVIGEKVLIGNGSEVEVTLEVYQTKRFGPGARLHSLKILDLIEYEKPEELTDNEVDEDDNDLNDEIPNFGVKEPEVNTEETAGKKKVKW